MPLMRPQLKPALHRVWRDDSTLQIGVDPGRAVVISGLDPPAARWVESLDGSRDRRSALASAAGLGLDAHRADELLGVLDRCGVLDDASADRRVVAALSQDDRDRLAPDLAAASVVHGGVDGGAAVLARRRAAVVSVRGTGRVGASVVSLLAAAGVGTVLAQDAAVTTTADLAPAGAARADVGLTREEAALRGARRVAPSVRGRPPRRRTGRTDSDLVVLAEGQRDEPDLPDRLLRRGVVHLFADVREGTGVVGPLVLPGRSSCRRCHELHRADRDPAWPSVVAQLSGAARRGAAPCDVVLATAVAAQAATQALAFLDGAGSPPAVDGTIEIAQVDGRQRRRGWTVHPLCGCAWAGR